uniref:Uncharacterized protein n=1 Tax=Romanomermis culicivorax TaxID=13658 RepID=A0A915JNS2_ROMCU
MRSIYRDVGMMCVHFEQNRSFRFLNIKARVKGTVSHWSGVKALSYIAARRRGVLRGALSSRGAAFLLSDFAL